MSQLYQGKTNNELLLFHETLLEYPNDSRISLYIPIL